MKVAFLVFFLIQIVTLETAIANSKIDEALYNALAAAFPDAIKYPGHYTQEISIADLRCTFVQKSKNYSCRAQDDNSQELIAKETDILVKALNSFKPNKIAKRKSDAAIFFSSIGCSMNSERTENGRQRQLFECIIEE